MKVLLVDDDYTMIEILQLLLAGPSVNIFTALNGSHALKILEENECDIMISDVNMPSMSGVKLSYEVRKRYPELFIILFSSELNGLAMYKKDLDLIGNITFVENKDISLLMDVFTNHAKNLSK